MNEDTQVTCLMWTSFSVNKMLLLHAVLCLVLLQVYLDVLRIRLEVRVSCSCCLDWLLYLTEEQRSDGLSADKRSRILGVIDLQ